MYLLWLFTVLRLSVRTWGFSALRMYVAITSPYLRDLGRYRVVSEPRFTPGVGNHLGQFVGSYQQYSQVQINWSVSEFGGSSNEYKNTMNLTIHSLTLLYSYSCQLEYLISFSLSFHLIASNPLVLVHYNTSPSRVPYRYQSAQRKCRGLVTFSFWGCKYYSHPWI